jgi:hypothetical protein
MSSQSNRGGERVGTRPIVLTSFQDTDALAGKWDELAAKGYSRSEIEALGRVPSARLPDEELPEGVTRVSLEQVLEDELHDNIVESRILARRNAVEPHPSIASMRNGVEAPVNPRPVRQRVTRGGPTRRERVFYLTVRAALVDRRVFWAVGPSNLALVFVNNRIIFEFSKFAC